MKTIDPKTRLEKATLYCSGSIEEMMEAAGETGLGLKDLMCGEGKEAYEKLCQEGFTMNPGSSEDYTCARRMLGLLGIPPKHSMAFMNFIFAVPPERKAILFALRNYGRKFTGNYGSDGREIGKLDDGRTVVRMEGDPVFDMAWKLATQAEQGRIEEWVDYLMGDRNLTEPVRMMLDEVLRIVRSGEQLTDIDDDDEDPQGGGRT